MNGGEDHIPYPACRHEIRQAGIHPVLKLLAGILLILFFIFGIGSLAQHIPGAKHMAQVIDERGLRATAIYYTDFEEPAEGSEKIRDSLDFAPRKRP